MHFFLAARVEAIPEVLFPHHPADLAISIAAVQ